MILGTCRFCFFMKQTLRNAFVTFIACIAATLFSQTVQAAAGDLYDGGLNAANNPIYKFDGAGNRTVFVSGNYTDALAFDSKGNLFAADPPDNLILKITPNGTTTTFAMNITPAGIAFDAAGNLFAIDTATDSIFKYTPSGTTRTTFAGPGIAGMNWLAFDRAGNLFVTITGNGQAGGGSIVKFASSCTSNCVPSTFYPVQPGGLWLPQGLAFDDLGNLYEADLGSGSIFRFTPTGTKTTFTSGLNGPRSLAFDTNGVLYAGEFGSHDIVKFPGGVKTAFSHDDTFIGGLAFEPPAAYDFNQDGKPDYVLYNAVTHQTAVWYLNNNVFVGGAYGPSLPANWSVVGVADFDADNKPDYLLFNSSTGQTGIWYLSGPTLVGGAFGPSIVSGYTLIGAADFDGDGKPDYALYSSAMQRTAVWYLNNNVFVGGAYGPSLPANWSLIAP